MTDYARKIAERILDSQNDRPSVPFIDLLAEAAREGYALGWAAKP